MLFIVACLTFFYTFNIVLGGKGDGSSSIGENE